MNAAQLILKENLNFEIEDIKLLIENGINMNRVDKNGMTLLDFAFKSNYVNLVDILLSHNFNFENESRRK